MSLWALDPDITFLNHGSFGACPLPVLEEQTRLRHQLEREPVRFMMREREPLADLAQAAVARFIGAHPHDVVPVANATTAVNVVLRSLRLLPGDELLVTDHGYNACLNACPSSNPRTPPGGTITTQSLQMDVAGCTNDCNDRARQCQ